MKLPEAFETYTKKMMGTERYQRFSEALDEAPPVSIRLNRWTEPVRVADVWNGGAVEWCPDGVYLKGRPSFTFDPMLHAGAYYVQEASSMFASHVLRQLVGRLGNEPLAMLDLCAAPGGKTTCALQALPAGSVLVANEPMRNRASVLCENLQKWLSFSGEWEGTADRGFSVAVTSNYARDFAKARLSFDLIMADVPCSGEGMFRKDSGAVGEWSEEHVDRCWRLQRDIVADIWPCLRPGGYLVYATCTFNTKENEENVQWIARQLGAEGVVIPVEQGWNITGSLLEDCPLPVCRFIPGYTRGEGLFMAVLRKHGDEVRSTAKTRRELIPAVEKRLHRLPMDHLTALHEAAEAPCVELNAAQAVAYLRREAVTLPPDVPRGMVRMCFQGAVLGLAKNVGNRANNLYPKEWRIKSTHVPEPAAIVEREL